MKLIPCIICFVVGCSIGLVPGVYSSGETDGTVTNARVIKRGSFYCVPKKCEINHYFILCNSNNSAKPGKDECIPCSHNTFNPNKNDTSTVPYQVPEYVVCKKPNCDCTPEGFLVNGHECHVNGAAKICLCDANKGYCGDDYQNCVKWTESDIRKDWGLTPNCSIKKCEKGYSRPDKKYACEKDSNISTTTQPTTQLTTGASDTDVNNNNSTEVDTTNTTTPSVNEDKGGGLDLKYILIIVFSLLAFLAVIIFGVWKGNKLRCRNKFGQFKQRMKNAVLKNGSLADPGDGERYASDESTEDTSMV